jgi:hypothetical protein
MIPWNERPTIAANLLNPAFCGEVLRRSIQSFQDGERTYFPYPLMFVILPILLHQETRQTLPGTTRTSFFEWITEHQHVKVHFYERAKSLVPYTREAFLFLLQHQVVEIHENGTLSVKAYRKKRLPDSGKEEIEEIFSKASFLGKWFSRSGDVKTIFAMLGIKP